MSDKPNPEVNPAVPPPPPAESAGSVPPPEEVAAPAVSEVAPPVSSTTTTSDSGNGGSTGEQMVIEDVEAQKLKVRNTEVLLRMYLERRIQNQLAYYQGRIREFEANSGMMVTVGAVIMAASTAISFFAATQNSPEWALATACLPVMAALVASFRQLYQWEKQSQLYQDAVLGLQEASLIMPDADVFDKSAAPLIFPRLVNSAENVFKAEIDQWGQIALGRDEDEDDELNQQLRELAQQHADRTHAMETGQFPSAAAISDGSDSDRSG